MSIFKSRYMSWVMWLLPLLFFAYQFILRLWPGLMMQHIMAQFTIDASGFGLLAACYYYGYAGMQIPVAMLLERFGARYIVFLFAVLCGLATYLFTYTTSFYLALFSRFLVGAGSAVGFLAVSKVVSEWFPSAQYARMIGLSFSVGLLGAIYGGKPIGLLIETYRWQSVASVLAILSISIGFCTFMILRSSTRSAPSQSDMSWGNMRKILTSPVLWCLAIANLLMVGSLEGFADVWGVPYLMTAYQLDKPTAASCVSFIFFGMLFGGPLLAFLSKRCGHYWIIAACGLGMASAFICLLTVPIHHEPLLYGLFFMIGIMCCYQVIIFAAGAAWVEASYLGVTVAFLNCVNMLGGSFFHTMIGRLMDLFWTGQWGSDGMKMYGLHAYHLALSLIPMSAIVGAVLVIALGIIARRQRH